MHVEFDIPTWLLWVLGVPGVLIVLALCGLGVVFLRFIRDFGRGW